MLGARSAVGKWRLGELAGECAEAVTVGDDPVAGAQRKFEDVDLQHIDRIVEDPSPIDTVGGEVGDGVAALVLEQSLVRERVDGDGRTGVDREDRRRGRVRKVAPQDVLRSCPHVTVPGGRSVVGL